MNSEEILDAWLSGTTCKRMYVKRKILKENDEYILLHHGSHAEYTGRFSGCGTCAARVELYKKAGLRPTDIGLGYLNRKHVDMWEGRTCRKDAIAACAARGIHFS